MSPPETTHTTLSSPALPARAEATEHAPAPSAITRLRSINSFTAAATSPNEEAREPASKELTNGHPSIGGNGTPTITYCDVQAGYDGVGNIELDPLFVDTDNDDFRIAATSPCIDAADNTAVPKGVDTDLGNNPRFVDDSDTKDTGTGGPSIVDMGAYEFQLDEIQTCPWDLDGDDNVGTSDLLELFAQWGTDGPADFDESGAVGTSDLIILFANWGPCSEKNAMPQYLLLAAHIANCST